MEQTTAKAEFKVVILVVNLDLWLRKIMLALDQEQQESMKVFVNNHTAMDISHNLIFHGKTKHLNIKLYDREVKFVYCKSKD